MYEEYDKIGKVNIFKESNLMPVIYINFNNYTRALKYDVFKKAGGDSKTYWKQRYEVDIGKLSRFINIMMIMGNKSNGTSKFI